MHDINRAYIGRNTHCPIPAHRLGCFEMPSGFVGKAFQDSS